MSADCIEWKGARHPEGYGQVWVKGKKWRAHRLLWTQANGPIPEGMCVCHRCDNPPCVNLEHLFLGTRADNSADMVAKGRQRKPSAGKTHCKHGHELTLENTYIFPSCRGRRCRTCVREANRKNWKERSDQRKLLARDQTARTI